MSYGLDFIRSKIDYILEEHKKDPQSNLSIEEKWVDQAVSKLVGEKYEDLKSSWEEFKAELSPKKYSASRFIPGETEKNIEKSAKKVVAEIDKVRKAIREMEGRESPDLTTGESEESDLEGKFENITSSASRGKHHGELLALSKREVQAATQEISNVFFENDEEQFNRQWDRAFNAIEELPIEERRLAIQGVFEALKPSLEGGSASDGLKKQLFNKMEALLIKSSGFIVRQKDRDPPTPLLECLSLLLIKSRKDKEFSLKILDVALEALESQSKNPNKKEAARFPLRRDYWVLYRNGAFFQEKNTTGSTYKPEFKTRFDLIAARSNF